VVCIKSKVFIMSLIIALLITVISIILTNNVLAREGGYDLDFVGEPEYKLIDTVSREGQTIGWSYQIYINIENNGDAQSKETILKITDEDDITLSKTIQLDPGQTENVTFNWSAVSNKDQNIEVSFSPSNLDIDKNQYNTGSTSFTLIIDEKDSSVEENTPGFEFILMFISLLIVTLILKRNKKR